MPAWVYTSSSPARRSARLMSTGRETGVIPYSDSATTAAPDAVQASSSGPSTSSNSAAAAAASGPSGPNRWWS